MKLVCAECGNKCLLLFEGGICEKCRRAWEGTVRGKIELKKLQRIREALAKEKSDAKKKRGAQKYSGPGKDSSKTRCEARAVHSNAIPSRDERGQCVNVASYVIDGRNICGVHAKQYRAGKTPVEFV